MPTPREIPAINPMFTWLAGEGGPLVVADEAAELVEDGIAVGDAMGRGVY